VVEKAQHEPHCPWFLTGVTAPLVYQSTDSGRLSVGACFPVQLLVACEFSLYSKPRYLDLNYYVVKSANKFIYTS